MLKLWSFALVLPSLLLLGGCDFEEVPANQLLDQTATVQLSLADEAQAAGSVKVVAVVAATGEVGGETTVRMGERTSTETRAEMRLRPELYILHVHAFADAEARVFLGARSAKLRMERKAQSPVKVLISENAAGSVGVGISGPDIETPMDQEGAVIGGGGSAAAGGSASGEAGGASAGAAGGGSAAAGGGSAAAGGGAAAGATGGGASAGGSASGSASGSGGGMAAGGGAVAGGAATGGGGSAGTGGGAAVMGGAAAGGATAGAGELPSAPLCIPMIDDVKVDVGDVVAKVVIKASGSTGGALKYIWSGAGFSGAIAGGATADIPCDVLSAAAGQTTSVLVQSKDGVVAQVKIKFDITSQLRLGVLKLGGTARTSIVTGAALAQSQKSCSDVYERCGGGCKATATAADGTEARGACFLGCGISLADCCERSR